MKNYVQEGDHIEITAGAAYSAGDLIEVGNLHGVATTDIANGSTGIIALEGVFTLPKQTGAAGDAVAGAGSPVYFKTGKVTGNSDTGANKLVGHALEAANQAAATVKVRLANYS